MGSGCQNEQEIALNNHEQAEAMETMRRLLSGTGRLNAQAGPQAKLAGTPRWKARRTGTRLHAWAT